MCGLQVRAPERETEWQAYYDLRWRILRAPWNQPRGSERDVLDASSVHRMVCDAQGRIMAVGRLQLDDKGSAQIRYMAVEPAYQRRGVGTLLLETLEHEARMRGISTLHLQARANAVSFYTRRGYRLIEPSHLLFGTIQHYKMEKRWPTCSA